MTQAERWAFVNEVIRNGWRERDFPDDPVRAQLARWYGPSERDLPGVTPERVVEQHLRTKPDRLKFWLERNATPEEVMKNADADTFNAYMIATEEQRADAIAQEQSRAEANRAALARGRETVKKNRAVKKAAEETPK